MGKGEKDEKSQFKKPGIYLDYAVTSHQHKALTELYKTIFTHKPKGKQDAVLYALPRVVDLAEYERFHGRLLLHTSFLSVKEINEEAQKAEKETGLAFDWNTKHRILMNLRGNDWELNRFFILLNLTDPVPELFTELVAIQITKAIKSIGELGNEVTQRSRQAAFSSYAVHLGQYLGVSFNELAEFLEDILTTKEYIDDWRRWYGINQEAQNRPSSFGERGLQIWKNLLQQINWNRLTHRWTTHEELDFALSELSPKWTFDLTDRQIMRFGQSFTDQQTSEAQRTIEQEVSNISLYQF